MFAYRSFVIYSQNEGNFPRCLQKTEKQIITHRHWCDCKNENARLTGATRSLSTTRRMKGQNARQPSPRQMRAHQPERSSKPQSPETNGSNPRYTRNGPPRYKDWTPEMRRPDPRGTRPQDPTSRTRTRASQDQGLRGIQDFVGFGTLWDSRLRGT